MMQYKIKENLIEDEPLIINFFTTILPFNSFSLQRLFKLPLDFYILFGIVSLQSLNIIINDHQQPMKLKIQVDICKINHPERFQAELNYDNLIEAFVFGRDQSISGTHQLRKTIQQEIVKLKFKWIYVGFKWLIFLNQCLHLLQQHPNLCLSVKNILALLNMIEYPQPRNKHQQYLCKKLFVPYLQYLVKLTSALQIKQQASSSLQSFIFIEFNLLRFAIAEFMLPICEFEQYFNQRFPHLSKCFKFLSQKVNSLHKKVTIHYELKYLQQMHFIEIDQLSQSVVLFSSQKQINHKSNSTLASNDVGKLKNSPFTEKIIQEFPQMESTSLVLNS